MRPHLLLFLLALGVCGAGKKNQVQFSSQFSSERELDEFQHPRLPKPFDGGVHFVDVEGRRVRELKLESSDISPGTTYQEEALPTRSGLILKKARSELDTTTQTLSLFDLDGNEISQIPNAERFWASPRGDTIVVVDQTNSVPLESTAKIRIYDSSGTLRAQHTLFDIARGDAQVYFSVTGQIFAFALHGYRDRPNQASSTGVAILNRDGALLGKHVQADWHFGGLTRNGKPTTIAPLLIVAERMERVLIQARAAGSTEPELFCLDFRGTVRWKKPIPLTERLTSFQASHDGEQFAFVELGDRTKVSVHSIDSGERIKRSEAPIAIPPGSFARISTTRNLLAISGRGLMVGGRQRSAAVINTDSEVQWTDDGTDANADAGFEADGKFIYRKRGNIHVGRFQ